MLKQLITFNFLPRTFLWVMLAFIAFTIIGTLSHEYGHIAVAKLYGYDTKLFHDSMTYYNAEEREDPLYKEMDVIFERNQEAIMNNQEYEEKERYMSLIEQFQEKYPPPPNSEGLWITAGGPIQTMLTSVLGLCILFYRRKLRVEQFALRDWVGVFLALFALREVTNFVGGVGSFLFFGKTEFYGDEYELSRYWFDNQWILMAVMALIGTIIAIHVIFRVLPVKYRFTFILGGLVGGVLGYWAWLIQFGHYFFPKNM